MTLPPALRLGALARHCITTATRASLATKIREPTVVGLKYDPNSRETLMNLYRDTLEMIQVVPEEAAYRKNVTSITEYRMGVVESEQNIDNIEATLGVGQIEEVIEQANDELELIPHMAKWAPWKMAENATKPKIEVLE